MAIHKILFLFELEPCVDYFSLISQLVENCYLNVLSLILDHSNFMARHSIISFVSNRIIIVYEMLIVFE